MTNLKERLLGSIHLAIAAAFVAVLVFLNFWLVRFWFEGEFNKNLASIEISYIQMAKFWSESGGSLWQPLWYLGYPWHVFYTPLLPALELLANNLANWSFGHAYRVITGVGYVLAPVSLFLFVWQIGKSKTGAFVAGLAYTFLPSVIALMFSEVAQDSVSGLLEPRRFAILVRWGEGPHTLALVFVPLFGLFLARYLEKKDSLLRLFLAALTLSLVALTNAVALWAAVLLGLAFLLGEFARRGADPVSVLKNFGRLLLLTFGLAAFWYNLPFIGTFFREGGGAFDNWLAMFPWGFLLILAVFVAGFILVRKFLGSSPGLVTVLFWFLMLFGIVYVYYASGENRLEYAPQALRFNTEVDLALAALLGAIVCRIWLFATSRKGVVKISSTFGATLIFGVVVAAILFWARPLFTTLPEHTRDLSFSPVEKVENTAEYKVSQNMKRQVGDSDERVFVPGNYAFWLNYFESTAQIRGALFQSSVHYWPEHIYYQVTNGSDAEISLAWLKIANIGKLIYSTIGSAEVYKDYKVPREKFDKILTVNFEEAGDIYYEIPLKNNSLAKVVEPEAILAIVKPKNAIDEEPIFGYLSQLEKHSERKLEFARVSAGHLAISGEVENGQGVLVQETYDSGWRVESRGNQGESGGIKGWKVVKDPLDFMVLVPKGSGRFEIDLVYKRPVSVWFGYLVTFGTIGWLVIGALKKRRFSSL